MIATLLASLLGFFGSTVPEVFKLWKDTKDKQHELTILKYQMDREQAGHVNRLEEINVNADISESAALYKTYSTGIHWVDALNGTVRPVIAYAFFLLYASVKVMHFNSDLPWLIWNEEDQVIFAGIISFYFGQRAMSKLRK